MNSKTPNTSKRPAQSDLDLKFRKPTKPNNSLNHTRAIDKTLITSNTADKRLPITFNNSTHISNGLFLKPISISYQEQKRLFDTLHDSIINQAIHSSICQKKLSALVTTISSCYSSVDLRNKIEYFFKRRKPTMSATDIKKHADIFRYNIMVPLLLISLSFDPNNETASRVLSFIISQSKLQHFTIQYNNLKNYLTDLNLHFDMSAENNIMNLFALLKAHISQQTLKEFMFHEFYSFLFEIAQALDKNPVLKTLQFSKNIYKLLDDNIPFHHTLRKCARFSDAIKGITVDRLSTSHHLEKQRKLNF